MSRISRYQESIEKFIKNKNINDYFTEEYSKNIFDNLIKSDHLGGIIVSTIFNHNSKKTNFKGHGYFVGLMIDIIIMILKSDDKTQNINYNLFIGLYKLLTENINLIKTTKHDTLNKIIILALSYFNNNIYDILIDVKIGEPQKMVKSDLLNLKSIDDKIYKKISVMNKYDSEEFITYIDKIYGKLGKLIFVLSWILGGGDISKDIIKSIELIGEKFGIIYKICYDFENIVSDINNMTENNNKDKTSKNIVINIGIQESFALFMETKSIFYEESFKLDIYTHTMKEVIDELENKLDKVLENCKIDVKSVYSSFTK
jgi:hypothetical protein